MTNTVARRLPTFSTCQIVSERRDCRCSLLARTTVPGVIGLGRPDMLTSKTPMIQERGAWSHS